MKTIFILVSLAFILTTCNLHQNSSEKQLSTFIKSKRFERVMNFDSTITLLRPSPNAFRFFREMKEKRNRDFLHRDNFVKFLKLYTHDNDLSFSALIIIETETSGELCVSKKSVIYSQNGHYYCLRFKTSISGWKAINNIEINRKSFDNLSHLISNNCSTTETSDGFSFTVITQFYNNKAISLITNNSPKEINQLI
ncbi:MAG: hypothetical protein Q8909_05560 [Bacteroidota bacterium]|nr:hypothetical protein [Bacteroidota bacterium]